MPEKKMTLSKREKRLIFIAAIFAILAVMVMLVILPLFNLYSDTTMEYNDLATRRAQMEVALMTEESIRAGYENELALFNHLRTIYSGDSFSSDIGRMLTQMVMRYDLAPISQNISPPTDFIPPSEDNGAEEYVVFSTMSVSMVVAGEYVNVKRLLDTIEDNQYIRVSEVTLRFSEDEYQNISTERINIKFEVLMLKEEDSEE